MTNPNYLPSVLSRFLKPTNDLEKAVGELNSVWLDADRMFEQFDRMFPVGVRNTTFPPRDIVKTKDGYEIALAVAGFKKEELSVTVDNDNILEVSGKSISNQDQSYLFKGIATRQFVNKFQLFEGDKVQTVSYVDGILSIKISRSTPAERQVKTIEIA